MSRRDPRWIAWLERGYTIVLRLYPRHFRRDWGQPMRQAFRDRCREVARGQRSPLLLASELLPDLVTGVAREQVLTLEQTTMLRRNVIFALLLAIAGTLVYFDRIDSALAAGVQDAQHWWVQHEQKADNEALASYRIALADSVVADVKNSRDHAVAALLYANGGVLIRQDEASMPVTQVGSSETVIARMQLAQQQWDMAVTSGDPMALWLSAIDCPVAFCDATGALARLEQQQPDNAAVTLLVIDQALSDGNEVALRQALDRIGEASHYQDYNGVLLQALLRADDMAALPRRLQSASPDNAKAAKTMLSAGLWSTRSLGKFTRLLHLCKPATGSHDPRQRDDCMAMARLMADASAPLPRAVGLRIQNRFVTVPSETSELHRHMRDFRWQLAHGPSMQMFVADNDAITMARLREAWLAQGSEIDVLRAMMKQEGVALAAPDDFRVTDDYFDPDR